MLCKRKQENPKSKLLAGIEWLKLGSGLPLEILKMWHKISFYKDKVAQKHRLRKSKSQTFFNDFSL